MSSVGFSYAQTYVQKKAVKEKMRRRDEEVEGGRPDMAMVRPALEARQGATSSGFSQRVHPTASDPATGNDGSGTGEMSG